MDIIERLRAWERGACMRPTLYDEAADEIDRLRAEVAALRAIAKTRYTDHEIDWLLAVKTNAALGGEGGTSDSNP